MRDVSRWPEILTVLIKRWERTPHIKLQTSVFPSLALSLQSNTGSYDLIAFLVRASSNFYISDQTKSHALTPQCHEGSSADTGHYYAVREGVDNRWYKCDDTKVTLVKTFTQNQQKSAYMHFYKQHGTSSCEGTENMHACMLT